MARHQVEVSGALAVPEVLGFVARGNAAYRGEWQTGRANRFAEEVVDRAGLTIEQLRDKVNTDRERWGDAFLQAVNRVVQFSDADYCSAFAQLLAAALDPEVVDEAEYFMGQIVKLDPVHLRVFFAAFTFTAKGRSVGQTTRPDEAAFARYGDLRVPEVAATLGLNPEFTQALVMQLSNQGWLTTDGHVTDWGFGVLERIFPHLDVARR